MSIAIKVENLSKAYQLGEIGTGTISRDLERWVAKVRGKEDPFLKIGEANDRAAKGTSDVVWSLKDINFEIQQGDAVGIIGRNGAGKSTLLKILSRVTSPTSGKITGKGRIASLLEVGTGFHPELTGKENIYLNGAILGMRKTEINRKFDEIVDFAGIERYIDTPVKRYSSGMYVRLAFAVAAHLESEILIVDEVLAVGDAEFQKKCLGKMNEVSKGEGRTVLFVSHNISAIRNLTEKVLYLKKGEMDVPIGSTNIMIERYLDENINLTYETENLNLFRRGERNPLATLQSIVTENIQNAFARIEIGASIHILIKIKALNCPGKTIINLIFKNGEGETVTLISSEDTAHEFELKDGVNVIELKIPENNFSPGKYFATIGVSPLSGELSYDVLVDYPMFEIYNDNKITFWADRQFGHFINYNLSWNSN